MLDELLLQGTVDLQRLGDDEQAAGAHVQPMGDEAAGIALLHDGLYRVVLDATGGGQHTAGLVDYQQPLVLVDGLQFHALESQ